MILIRGIPATLLQRFHGPFARPRTRDQRRLYVAVELGRSSKSAGSVGPPGRYFLLGGPLGSYRLCMSCRSSMVSRSAAWYAR